MAEKYVKKTWCEVLVSVYDLLLENADDVVDDTSLEKLLGWLEEICKDDVTLQKLLAVDSGTLNFLQHERVFGCSKTLAVALRLCGLLCRKEEGSILLSTHPDGNIVEKLFSKVAADAELWRDAGVRDAYFTAMLEFVGHEEGCRWLKQSDCLSAALQCIEDRSMFVAVSARVFLVKYVMKCYIQAGHHEGKTIPLCIASMTKRFQEILCEPQAAVARQRIAVIDVVRMFIEEDAVCGSAFVQRTGLLVACLQQIKTADLPVCDKLLDVLRELMTKKKILNWGELLQQQGGGVSEAATEVILELPVTLLSRGFISQGLYLIAALGSYQDCPSDCPISWLNVLFELLTATVNVALTCLCKEAFMNHNDSQMNGKSETDIKSIVKHFTERTKHDCERVDHDDPNLHHIVAPWLHTRGLCSDVVCQAINASQELLKLADDPACFPVVASWVRLVLRMLKASFISTAESPGKLPLRLYGNERVLKSCLSCIAKFAEGPSPGRQGKNVTELCKELLEVMIVLIENSETSTTAISCALKTMGNLLKGAGETFTNDIFHGEDEYFFISAKRTRRVAETETENGDERTTTNEIQEKLGFVLHRKLRDPRWEVRDSVLELLLILVEIRRDPVAAFLRQFNIPSAVWGALSDTGESFVRASALQALAALSCRDQLWSNLLQTGRLTEVDVVKKVAGVLLEDDEAFPRRRAAACLVQWVKAQHPAIRTVLEPGGRGATRDEHETNSVPPDAGQVTKGAEQLRDIVAVAICHACQDFDWEVKLLGIQFLEAVVDHFMASSGNEVNAPSYRPAFSHTLGESPVPPRERCLCALASMGACKVLVHAVNDCDHMVCEAALLLLIKLKKFCFPQERSGEGPAPMPEELQECLSTHCEISLDQFREILKETNFTAALRSSTAADSSVRSDPVSFLQDILSAAADHEENLLDCY